jgi:hypothetical protein
MLIGPEDFQRAADQLGFPMVLKVPDSSFSRGVSKVGSMAELRKLAGAWLAESEVLIAQAYMPTSFDWRIGVLGGKPLFAVQYLMAKKHWQIVKHDTGGKPLEGGFKPFTLAQVPPLVLDTGLRAARSIGDGLYGVDLKETDDGVFVIEVNDNPQSRAWRRGRSREGRGLDPADQLVHRAHSDLRPALMRQALRLSGRARAVVSDGETGYSSRGSLRRPGRHTDCDQDPLHAQSRRRQPRSQQDCRPGKTAQGLNAIAARAWRRRRGRAMAVLAEVKRVKRARPGDAPGPCCLTMAAAPPVPCASVICRM